MDCLVGTEFPYILKYHYVSLSKFVLINTFSTGTAFGILCDNRTSYAIKSLYKKNQVLVYKTILVHSAGAVEYTNCISAEG